MPKKFGVVLKEFRVNLRIRNKIRIKRIINIKVTEVTILNKKTLIMISGQRLIYKKNWAWIRKKKKNPKKKKKQ